MHCTAAGKTVHEAQRKLSEANNKCQQLLERLQELQAKVRI